MNKKFLPGALNMELIELAKKLSEAEKRGETTGLSEDEQKQHHHRLDHP